MPAPTPQSLAHNGTEDNHQAAIFCWAALAETQAKFPEFKNLFFAIPNGGERHIAVAAKMKATGSKAGTLDMFLAVPKKGYHGAFIELKIVNGRPSTKQLEFQADARAQGFAAEICVGWEAAVAFLVWYMTD